MENQLVHQLEMLSAGRLCVPFARRVAMDLAEIRRGLDDAACERLEAAAARILGRQLAAAEGIREAAGGQTDLADALFEIVLRLAPDDGTRH